MIELPGGTPSICDGCEQPIVGPVFRVGIERFCKNCKETTDMAGRRLTIEDFPLKEKAENACWIQGCSAARRGLGLCQKHYDSVYHAGLRDVVVAQIQERNAPQVPMQPAIEPPTPPSDAAWLELKQVAEEVRSELEYFKEKSRALESQLSELRNQKPPIASIRLTPAALHARLGQLQSAERIRTALQEGAPLLFGGHLLQMTSPLKASLEQIAAELETEALEVRP